jgi:probable phosphoglycerate mutase
MERNLEIILGDINKTLKHRMSVSDDLSPVIFKIEQKFKGIFADIEEMERRGSSSSSNYQMNNNLFVPGNFSLYKELIFSNKIPFKRLYFCRHGETDANRRGVLQGGGLDEPLNGNGHEQGKALGDVFKSRKIDVIYTSKLRRSIETAEYIRRNKNNYIKMEKFMELNEISWGIWEGLSDIPGRDELLKKWEECDFNASAPNGESPNDCIRRAFPVIQNIIESEEEYSDILFVVHGRLLRIILAFLLQRNLLNMSSFSHHNTNINIIDVYKNVGDSIDFFEKYIFVPMVLDDYSHVIKYIR